MVEPINNIAMNMSPVNFSSEVIELKKKELSKLQAHYKTIIDEFGLTNEKSKIVFNDVIALEREIKKLEKSRKRQKQQRKRKKNKI